MNTLMITKLINKDWQLYKLYIAGYIALGCIAAILMTMPSYTVFYIGVVWLITILIGASAHIILSTTISEIKESQFSFLMGLPIKPIDYTISKLIGGLGIYLVCWLPIVAVLIGLILTSKLPDGMVPIALILCLEILVAAAILLCVSILSSSLPVSIIVMVILNVFFNLFMFYVAGLNEIGPFIEQPDIAFNSTVFTIIAAEIGVIALVVSVTLYIKSRKACFL
ncbi:hypothetical protein L0668_07035 [Paraglaciecola aquimarina]|uniref:ABC transporter permease n=1 Tax=Paraglaciecola algarum TaxID=3050085 RepID=A0ABS9D5A1_9ALTE|nr:hypothetical protein [Paraglaciecola sp. G1-23]MCF2947854.1 hypothetical protein [Paraglaciecola sp. G1-23]